jgi:hypothetical protein
MARYRIVQKPRHSDPTQPIYEVQKRELFFFWGYVELCLDISDAEHLIQQYQEQDGKKVVETKVVKEYK